MRILLVSPWARALSRVYCDELERLGHEVRLVTTTRHFERQEPRPYELILEGMAKRPRDWVQGLGVAERARRFRPDVVVAEEFADPRLLPLLRLAPVVTTVHDDAPHDAAHDRARRHQLVLDRVTRTARLLVTFSEFVADRVRPDARQPVVTLPLPSEADEHLVPAFVAAEDRRDVVLIGRMYAYKNLPGTFEAWAQHTRSAAYRGDRLLVIGDGDHDGALPPRCEWRRERFQFRDVLPVLAAAKASLAYYSAATQSGVQVVSMQCGTTTLVSDSGGLGEYLPPGETPVPLGRPDLLAAALDDLADPQQAVRRGAAAQEHFTKSYHRTVAAGALADVLEGVAAEGAAARAVPRRRG